MIDIEKFSYASVREEVYHSRLMNGLEIYILKKPLFTEKAAMLTVNFGSIDSNFTVRNRAYQYPEGIAHFLEHKLFENESGQDVSHHFTALGADVNAFTTFEKTSYFFSTSNNFTKCLTLLQEFVLTGNFTEESVVKERKIIAQEIDMYLDDPDYQSYIGILQNLFPNSLLSSDIAGNQNSLESITATDLQRYYKQFYHPSNMTLIIVGDVDIEETYRSIEDCQERLKQRRPAKATINNLPYSPIAKTNSMSMEISTPKLVVGYRGKKFTNDVSLLRYKVGLRLLLSLLFGWTSKTYQTWYDQGKIDDSFDMEIEIQRDFSFLLITLDTNEPIAMSSNIRKKINNFTKSKDLTLKHLQLLKKEMFGDFVQSLDSIEQVMSQFNLFLNDQDSYFEIPQIIETITLDDILAIGNDFFDGAEASDFTVFPK